jgi:hypothetical protein
MIWIILVVPAASCPIAFSEIWLASGEGHIPEKVAA